MKQTDRYRYYIEGNTLITIDRDMRSTRCYQTDQQAAAAYDALPGQHHEAPWPVETRAEARAADRKHYYTGRLCANNHSARRYTATGACIPCHAGYQAASQRRTRGTPDGMVSVRLAVYPCEVQAVRDYAIELNRRHATIEGRCEVCDAD